MSRSVAAATSATCARIVCELHRGAAEIVSTIDDLRRQGADDGQIAIAAGGLFDVLKERVTRAAAE